MRPWRHLALGLFAGGLLTSPATAQISLVEGGSAFSMKVTSMRDIPFRTVVRQQYDYSCGSAALATLLRYHYGVPIGEAEIFKAMYDAGDQEKIREVGFSLLDMKRYLEARGLKADGYRATLAQLEAAKAPALSVISIGTYRHFVVIKGVRDGQVLVGDPSLGLKTYSAAEFSKMWNGVIFAVHGRSDLKVAYNQDEEWRPWAVAPLGQPMSEGSLSAFTRSLPPIYQITNSVFATGAF
jgi:predicted double-glycine peptidase